MEQCRGTASKSTEAAMAAVLKASPRSRAKLFYNVGKYKFPAASEFDVVGNLRNTVVSRATPLSSPKNRARQSASFPFLPLFNHNS